MLRRLCRDLDTALVVRALLAFKDAFYLLELTTYLDNHFLRGASDSVHCHTTEQECHHRSDENSGKDTWIHQVNLIVAYNLRNRGFGHIDNLVSYLEHSRADVLESDLDLLNVRSKECKRRKGGGSDRESLAGGGCRVAEGVKSVSAATNLRIQLTHLGVAAGVVGDRAVSVGRKGDSKG